MHNAITLENVTEAFYDSFVEDVVEDFQENEATESLEDNGISSDNIYLSLGIFGICLIVLTFGLLLYSLTKICSRYFFCCSRLMQILKA